MKLSERAKVLLVLIAEHSDIDEGGRFWAASASRNGQWSDDLNGSVHVSHSGDARIIRSLWAKGLLREKKQFGGMPIPYASYVTEEGRVYVERMREAGTLPDLRGKDW